MWLKETTETTPTGSWTLMFYANIPSASTNNYSWWIRLVFFFSEKMSFHKGCLRNYTTNIHQHYHHLSIEKYRDDAPGPGIEQTTALSRSPSYPPHIPTTLPCNEYDFSTTKELPVKTPVKRISKDQAAWIIADLIDGKDENMVKNTICHIYNL